MKRSLIIKQLEGVLSQKIKDLYQEKLKQELENIQYHVFENTIVMVIEGSTTQVERFLETCDRQKLARKVRLTIDGVFKDRIKNLIEESIDMKIVDFLFDTNISSSRTGALIIFEVNSQSS